MARNKKKSNKWIWISLGLIIAALLAASFFMKKGGKSGITLDVENAEKRTIKETVSASGKVFPEVEINVSSDVSGELVELYVEEGDSVTAGQILGKIDPDLYKSAVDRGAAAVDNAKAQVANSKANKSRAEATLQQSIAQKKQVQAQLENARAVFKRNEQLLKDGVIAQADFDNAQSSLRSLEANLEASGATVLSAQAGVDAAEQTVKSAEFSVKSAEATFKETKTSLNRTSIYSPLSGIVSYLGKEKGETVLGTTQMSGDIIFKIANLSNMEVQVSVSENDVLRVNLKDKVEIEVDAYLDRKFTGVVTDIANSASNTTGTAALASDQVTNFTVKIRIDRESYKNLITKNKRFAFRPGMSASVDINTETQEGILTVPIQSVTTRELSDEEKEKAKDKDEDMKEVVFVYTTADTVAMREVKTGIQDDTYIQVLDGIQDGDIIVTGPYSAISKKLKDGTKVKEAKNKDDKDKKDEDGDEEEG